MNRYELLRYERGLSIRDVALGAGVSIGTLVGLEADTVAKPNARTAKALADFYEIPVADLLGIAADKDAA